jgi:hypothetical protein
MIARPESEATGWPQTDRPELREAAFLELQRRFAGRAKWRENARHAEERKGRE